MPDIRDVLKGLSLDDRALYTELRTSMRRTYLLAHSKLLPIDKYEATDDAFLDLIDIKIAMLFERGGAFDHNKGVLNVAEAESIEQSVKQDYETAASKMIKQPLLEAKPWPVQNKVN